MRSCCLAPLSSSMLVVFALITSLNIPAYAQAPRPPSTAATALATVEAISGDYSSPVMPTNGWGMPNGPVLGNGDVGVVLEGSPDKLKFAFGKSDFFGVLRGGAMPVGSLSIAIPALKDAPFRVSENIGPATLTGNFAASNGTACTMTSWVAANNNTTVIQLHNTGSMPLTVSDQLNDNFGTSGNSATFGASLSGYATGVNSTWLTVSPDDEIVDLGNRLHGGKPDPLNGEFYDVNIYSSALAATDLGANASPQNIVPFYAWNPSNATVLGTASAGDPGDRIEVASVDNSPASAIELGAMRLPQSQFTITARVNVSSFSAEQGIFTALGDPLSPRDYPFERGVELELINGCLSGKLNTTAVTAATPLPLNKWVKVAMVYDSERISLYSDGVLVATTTDLPTTADVNGWDQKSLHFGDPELPFDGDGPVGLMVQKVIGSQAKINGSQLTFTIPAHRTAAILVAVETDRNTPNYWKTSFADVNQVNIPALEQKHNEWWKAFWSKSFVKISDTTVENYWYGSLYIYACCSKAGCPPPGLWGNLINSPYAVGWQGDYTLDYNAEAPPWAGYESNHFELADNYEDPLLAYIPRAAAIAAHNQYPGLYFYTHLIPGPGWDDDPSQFMNQKSATVFGCVDCAMRWKLTGDVRYAKKVYPLLRGTADFWDHYLKLQNGLFVDTDDATDEFSPGATNTATTIAFLHMLYQTLIPMSGALGRDSAMRPIWQNIDRHLSPLPIVKAASIDHVNGYPDNQTLEQILGASVVDDKLAIRDSQIGTGFPNPRVLQVDDHEQGTSAGMNSTQVIFPGWQIGLKSSSDEQEAANETVSLAAEWFDGNDDCTFYPSAAIAGYDPQQILGHLDRLIKDHSSPSFVFHSGGGGIEDVSIIPEALSQMFQQSFQGVIHVFPNWPKTDDASYGNIPACGGFLLSSAQKAGHVQYIEIISNAGDKCVLANPWLGSKVKVTALGRSKIFTGSEIVFPTTVGEDLVVTPI